MLESFQKVFKALGEPTRLKILKLIYTQPMCVCELSAVLDMLQPRVSQHLRILKEAGLVSERKEGYFTYYNFTDEKVFAVFEEFRLFLKEPMEEKEGFKEISQRIADLEDNEKVKQTKAEICKKKGDDDNS